MKKMNHILSKKFAIYAKKSKLSRIKEIPIVFHNCATNDYHFIIKELAKELNGQLE